MLPRLDELHAFLRATTPNDPGIGILDIRSGQIYLSVASGLPDGDHASLAEQALGITEADDAGHLRGFVVGFDSKDWRIINNSGLNPNNNRMEPELFEEITNTLLPLLRSSV